MALSANMGVTQKNCHWIMRYHEDIYLKTIGFQNNVLMFQGILKSSQSVWDFHPIDGWRLKLSTNNPAPWTNLSGWRFSNYQPSSASAKQHFLFTFKLTYFQPIGSMYAIYGNIYHQYTPNVSIYTIHGFYGQLIPTAFDISHFSSWSRHVVSPMPPT